MHFRLATYNIRKGKGASGKEDGSLDDLGAAMASHKPDVMLCQEVYHAHDNGPDQSAVLSGSLGLRAFYEANRHRRRGHHGNATFSRFPVDAMQNHDITTNPIEKRGVLYTRTVVQGRVVHVFNVHLGLNQPQRLRQIRKIGHIIASTCAPDDPVLLAGDFNDWTRRIDREVVTKLGLVNAFAHVKGPDALTWHARRPVFNLDRVYLRHLRAERTQRLSGMPWTDLSDHFPLVVDLALT